MSPEAGGARRRARAASPSRASRRRKTARRARDGLPRNPLYVSALGTRSGIHASHAQGRSYPRSQAASWRQGAPTAPEEKGRPSQTNGRLLPLGPGGQSATATSSNCNPLYNESEFCAPARQHHSQSLHAQRTPCRMRRGGVPEFGKVRNCAAVFLHHHHTSCLQKPLNHPPLSPMPRCAAGVSAGSLWRSSVA